MSIILEQSVVVIYLKQNMYPTLKITDKSQLPARKFLASLSSYLLSFCITIGWIFGCIPIKSRNFYQQHELGNYGKSVGIPISKNILMFLYNLSIIVVKLSVYISVTLFSKASTSETPTSTLILAYVTIITWIYSDFLRRIFYISHSKLIQQIFNTLNTIKSTLPGNAGNAESRIVMLALITMILSIFERIADALHGLIGLNFFNSTPEELIQLIPTLALQFMFLFTDWASKVTSFSFIILLAYQLLICYENIMEQILKGTLSPCLSKFLQLQQCFTLYNRLVGFLIIITLAQGSTLFLYNIYELGSQFCTTLEQIRRVRLILELLELGFTLYLVAYVGQCIKNKVKVARLETLFLE